MAIDPNIALGIQPMQPVDLTKIQQLRLLMGQEELQREQLAQARLQQQLTQAQIPQVLASTEITRAQLPGVQATSAITARTAEAQALASKFKDEIKSDADLVRVLSREGFQDKANEFATKMIANEAAAASSITNATAAADAQRKLLENATTNLAGIGYGLDDKKLAELSVDWAKKMNKIGQIARIDNLGDMITDLISTTDPKTGEKRIDRAKLNAIRYNTIATQAQEQLRVEAEQRLDTPEGRDPNSDLSKRVRAAYESAGYRFPVGTSGRDIFRMAGVPQFALSAMERQEMPQAVRADNAVIARDQSIIQQQNKSAIDLLEAFPDQFADTIVGTMTEQAFRTYISQDPRLAGIMQAIDTFNQRNPNNPIKLERFNRAQALERLRQDSKEASIKERKASEMADRPSISPQGRMPSGRADEKATMELRGREIDAIIQGGSRAQIQNAIVETQNAMNLAFQKDKKSAVGEGYKEQLGRLNDALKQRGEQERATPAAPARTITKAQILEWGKGRSGTHEQHISAFEKAGYKVLD
jgi:hypothetical protein